MVMHFVFMTVMSWLICS